MESRALLVGISYELFDCLNTECANGDIELTYAITVADGIRQFAQRHYHLVLIDLQNVHRRNRLELLSGLRQARFVPILALTDRDGAQDAARILDYGVDICMPADHSPLLICKHAKALIRRYTAYNHFDQPESVEVIPFQCGDIYIDPLRRTVLVRNEPVELRPREFSLLLYFMQNPGIVLTAEQICDHAWGMEGSYGQGVAHPVRLLRRAIEPCPDKPIYIETVYRVGYRFTAVKAETCEWC